jgi:predicted Zn-dependent protease
VSDPVGRRPAIYLLAARLPAELARDALAFAREGREAFPDDVDLRRLEIDLLRAAGDAAGASAALGSWVETGSAPVREVVAFAEALASQGRFDEAQAWLATIADVDDDADLRSARIELAAGRARAALTTLEPSVASGEADALRRTLYAIALGRIGRADEATAMLEDVARSAAAPEADARTVEAGRLAERALAVLADQRQVSGADAVALSPDASTAFEQGLFALENGDMVTARDAFVRARGFDDAGCWPSTRATPGRCSAIRAAPSARTRPRGATSVTTTCCSTTSATPSSRSGASTSRSTRCAWRST